MKFQAEFSIIVSQEDWKKMSAGEVIIRTTEWGDKIAKLWLTDDELTMRIG